MKIDEDDTLRNKNLYNLRKKIPNKVYHQEYISAFNFNANNEQEENYKNERTIVNKIKMTRACIYLCFCFTRKRKNVQNVLLDEGMNIISKKLDIFNIFDKLYRDEKIHEKYKKNELIEMSDESKTKLQYLNN